MHYTALDIASDPPYEIIQGRAVEFTYEAVADQDGFRFRAVRVQVEGLLPGDRTITPTNGSGYRSKLTLQYDDEDA
jgi:hypothetical protein